MFQPDGTVAGMAQNVADGYAVLVGPLGEGEHVIEITTQGARTTYRLTVVSGALAAARDAGRLTPRARLAGTPW